MAYKVVVGFKDLRDGGYEYKSGDKYPHSGTADPDRAAHLMTPTSQRGALIEKVTEEVTKTAAKETTKPVTKKKQEK